MQIRISREERHHRPRITVIGGRKEEVRESTEKSRDLVVVGNWGVGKKGRSEEERKMLGLYFNKTARKEEKKIVQAVQLQTPAPDSEDTFMILFII